MDSSSWDPSSTTQRPHPRYGNVKAEQEKELFAQLCHHSKDLPVRRTSRSPTLGSFVQDWVERQQDLLRATRNRIRKGRCAGTNSARPVRERHKELRQLYSCRHVLDSVPAL